ncbi:NACHT domain-containing protein, partial [Salmonella enterica subsp. enterica serovar Kentucky]|uniref:NACHT domain-containing protein n=1 Tax=Salmonella enterica TaxID=28901 RepID=UPI003F4C127C
ITGKIDDILRKKVPVELENIFKETKGQHRKILIEGAPGCGKSTLSQHICHQWAEGKLFQEYKQVILVQLREQVVQTA